MVELKCDRCGKVMGEDEKWWVVKGHGVVCSRCCNELVA